MYLAVFGLPNFVLMARRVLESCCTPSQWYTWIFLNYLNVFKGRIKHTYPVFNGVASFECPKVRLIRV